MSIFGMGVPELAIIGLVAVVVFGPKKLPELGSSVGKAIRGFKDEMSSESGASTEASKSESAEAE